jgi:flagellar assembly protein FliH
MAEQKTLTRKKPEKFFFDKNNFDDDFIETIEEEEPPPPVFSEEELDAAKKQAFEKGKVQGLSEAKESYEKNMMDTLQKILEAFPPIIVQEEQRHALYEREAVELSYHIFKKLYPVLEHEHGLNEIQQVITEVLNSQREESEIIIEIKDSYAEDIQNLINYHTKNAAEVGKVSIIGREEMAPSDCKMSWKEGGMIRNSSEIAEKIEHHLKLALADRASVADNTIIEEENKLAEQPLSQPPETETNNE